MRLLTVVGARPQFIKAAALSRAMEAHNRRVDGSRVIHEFLVHTGQHYDDALSDVFFRELDIPRPDVNLGVGSGPHGEQTGAMLAGIEKVLLAQKPDWVLVYGDDNSTLAGALAASKLHIPVAHVEAGLRSFNRAMPEEINRVVVDHLSAVLFCPSQTAVDNLASEGIHRGVHLVGDVMAEALAFAVARARTRSDVLGRLGLSERGYVLATVHRAENTDDPRRLRAILGALDALDEVVVFPAHPRTCQAMSGLRYTPAPTVRLIEPQGYLDMVCLAGAARLIVTDSGGLQKEAYWLEVPCLTVREETEWVETVRSGWNVLVGTDVDRIVRTARSFVPPAERPALYHDGQAATRCIALLESES